MDKKAKFKKIKRSAKQLQQFCKELSEAYFNVEKVLESIEIDFGKEADWGKVHQQLDQIEEVLLTAEARKYGLNTDEEISSFKRNQALYRHGFTHIQVVGDLETGGESMGIYLDLHAGTHIQDTIDAVKEVDTSFNLTENQIMDLILENITPEQYELMGKLHFHKVLVTPRGSLEGKMDFPVDGFTVDSTSQDILKTVKPRGKYQIAFAGTILPDLAEIIDLSFRNLYAKAPKKLDEAFPYLQKELAKYGVEIMDVHDYLAMLRSELVESSPVRMAQKPPDYLPPEFMKRLLAREFPWSNYHNVWLRDGMPSGWKPGVKDHLMTKYYPENKTLALGVYSGRKAKIEDVLIHLVIKICEF